MSLRKFQLGQMNVAPLSNLISTSIIKVRGCNTEMPQKIPLSLAAERIVRRHSQTKEMKMRLAKSDPQQMACPGTECSYGLP